MKFDVLTIFPSFFDSFKSESLVAKAIAKKIVSLRVHNLRDWAEGRHQVVDDKPYGGGPGMVLKVEPIYKALKALKVKSPKQKIVMLDPAGKQFDQKMAQKFSKLDRIVFVCGRYEGFDERISEFVDERISIGPYVVNGGEVPAMIIMEAVGRLVPGFIGKAESLKEETFSSPFFAKATKGTADKSTVFAQETVSADNSPLAPYKEYPQYTRPEVFEYKKNGKTVRLKVPAVLTEGNHAKIREWRRKKAE